MTEFSDENGTASARKIEMIMMTMCCELLVMRDKYDRARTRCCDALSNAFRYRFKIAWCLRRDIACRRAVRCDCCGRSESCGLLMVKWTAHPHRTPATA